MEVVFEKCVAAGVWHFFFQVKRVWPMTSVGVAVNFEPDRNLINLTVGVGPILFTLGIEKMAPDG